jgi:mRNA deadenylase 3'-5' endonuclease subunit Ccr4
MSTNSSVNTSVNLFTWNLLSTELASPSYHTLCDPKDLETKNRWTGIQKILTEKVEHNTIICLQELSERWLGYLLPFFQANNYTFIYDSQWLGDGIAFPNVRYRLHEVNIVKIGEELKKICKPKLLPTTIASATPENLYTKGYTKGWVLINSMISKLNLQYKSSRVVEDTWTKSIKKHNRLIGVRLQQYGTGAFFNVFTYHMPCDFREPSVMHIHTSMVLRTVKKLTGKLPYILAGDFNLKPTSTMYQMITKGGDYEEHFEKSNLYNTPEITVNENPLRSVYGFHKEEPAYTCFSQPKGAEEFLDCIDYIFISPEFNINSISELPKERPKQTFPNQEVFSDHLPLSCELHL